MFVTHQSFLSFIKVLAGLSNNTVEFDNRNGNGPRHPFHQKANIINLLDFMNVKDFRLDFPF